MTRINCVPPTELCWEHLVAEYRELPRVFGLVQKAQDRGCQPATLVLPQAYTLGAGHVRFFYDKCTWLLNRQHSLIDEMRARGYRPRLLRPEDLVQYLKPHWMGDWEPTPVALALCRARLQERQPKPRIPRGAVRGRWEPLK